MLNHIAGIRHQRCCAVSAGLLDLTVDKDNKVTINSPETAKALEYVKSLYENFIPGTISWNDSSNNKAFLAGQLHLTTNGMASSPAT